MKGRNEQAEQYEDGEAEQDQGPPRRAVQKASEGSEHD
jgi:hypothetical protein